MQLAPISNAKAAEIFQAHSQFRGAFDFAISVRDEQGIHGVIALLADGEKFALAHLYTDANAQVGSLLYGGAWRVAKALGYKEITI